MNKLIESYIKEYPQSYVYIDVKGKTVLDIGADVGTSALWFIGHGAEKVICYSLDKQEVFNDKIVWCGEWHGEYIPADVLKIDCEGCECMLTPELINKYQEWYIAVHTFSSCYNPLREYLEQNGKLVFITPDKKEYLYAKRL